MNVCVLRDALRKPHPSKKTSSYQQNDSYRNEVEPDVGHKSCGFRSTRRRRDRQYRFSYGSTPAHGWV
jgi:hypothetical protein